MKRKRKFGYLILKSPLQIEDVIRSAMSADSQGDTSVPLTPSLLQGDTSVPPQLELVSSSSDGPFFMFTPTSPLPPFVDEPFSWTDADDTPPPSKRAKHTITEKSAENTRFYLRLRSGDTYLFEATDGNDILLPEHEEPDPYLRKLVAAIPSSITQRMIYLSRFVPSAQMEESDQWNEIVESNPPTAIVCLRTQLFSAYLKEMKLRIAFRKVVQRWRIRAMDRRETGPQIDPITLEAPLKPVTVYDFSNKKKYVFDAHSISSYIESKLLYHENGFASPIYPRNPWTNARFSYTQLVSLYQQLRAHGEVKWAFLTFRECQFDESRWLLYQGSSLTMNAIRSSIVALDTADGRDLLEDFLIASMDELQYTINDSVLSAYRVAMQHLPQHGYIQSCKKIALMHYEAVHFQLNRKHMIRDACRRVFSRQWNFFQELFEKKLIRHLPSVF